VSECLIDTSVLARLVSGRDPRHKIAEDAVAILKERGARLSIAPQNIIELWAVSTRRREANGFGLSTERTATEIDRIQVTFAVLDDPVGTFRRWRQLVQGHDVKGRQVYDARLAAIMLESNIEQILTFNVDDFRRYPGITAVSPHDLAAVDRGGKPE
jgi:predicted nucleic acid-binding protein